MSKYVGNIVTTGADTGYSVAFDGTGDYLSVASNAALQLSSSDFTVEFWVYLPAAFGADYKVLIGKGSNAANTREWYLEGMTAGSIDFFYSTNGTTYTNVTVTSVLSVGQWYNIVLTRSGSTLSCWTNGTRTYNNTSFTSTLYSGSGNVQIGGYNDGVTTLYSNSYISNVRIVKGTELYSGATINLPTQLFNITNTSLLTCNSPAIIDQSSNAFAITANGDAKVSTFTPFTGYSATPPNANTQSNTSGIWTVSEAEYWMAQNQWPMPYPRQSLRFNSADSARLTRTNSVTGNQKTMTFSFWMKRTKLGTNQQLFSTISGSGAVPRSGIGFTTSDTFDISFNQTGSAWIDLITTQVFRDVSSWYHLVIAIDTTQATSSNRVKLYVNGSQVTAFGTAQYPTQNADLPLNWSTYTQYLGSYTDGTQYADMYGADWTFVDGLALDSSYFGQTDSSTGAWIPQNYTGNYGTNGFRLTFQNNTGTTATTLGKDWSGKGNNWTPANFSIAAGTNSDSVVDSPWNFGVDNGLGGEVRGNYCTWNPLFTYGNQTLSNGNLDIATGTSGASIGTVQVNTGKWYWEIYYTTAMTSGSRVAGIVKSTTTPTGMGTGTIFWQQNGTYIINNGSAVSYGTSAVVGDVIGVAIDVDAQTIVFYKNGVAMGSAISISAVYSVGDYITPAMVQSSAISQSCSANFGQKPFATPAPSGYKALCTTNLPKPAIGATSTTLANTYFDVSLWSGDGTYPRSITGLNFKPDFLWEKTRTGATTDDHLWADVLRGVGNTHWLSSSLTSAEGTYSTNANLVSFDNNGFTIGTSSSTNVLNAVGRTLVGWVWKANGSGVSNTSGTITSTVSANTTSGFSIVAYTSGASGNATIGHGLSTAPSLIITKSRTNGTANWSIYHSSVCTATTQYLDFTTAAKQTFGSAVWGAALPTSTVFGITNGVAVTASTNCVAYCFSQVAGFSSFGVYTGNNSADGPFVYTGIRSRYIMIKRTDAAAGWFIFDTTRNPYNSANLHLQAQSTAIEGTATAGTPIDILSNGFKIRSDGTSWPELNASSGTYIYAAFAETPFNYSRAR